MIEGIGAEAENRHCVSAVEKDGAGIKVKHADLRGGRIIRGSGSLGMGG